MNARPHPSLPQSYQQSMLPIAICYARSSSAYMVQPAAARCGTLRRMRGTALGTRSLVCASALSLADSGEHITTLGTPCEQLQRKGCRTVARRQIPDRRVSAAKWQYHAVLVSTWRRKGSLSEVRSVDGQKEAQPNIARMAAPAIAKPTVSPAPHKTRLPISVPTFCAENCGATGTRCMPVGLGSPTAVVSPVAWFQ